MSKSSRVKFRNPYSKDKINSNPLTPTQFKGRFIKTNSRSAHDTRTEIITTQTLQKYYNILLSNHFQFPQPSPQVFDMGFSINFNFPLVSMFSSSFSVYPSDFARFLIQAYEPPLPPLPSGYHWEAYVPYFQIYGSILSNQDTGIFTFQSVTPDYSFVRLLAQSQAPYSTASVAPHEILYSRTTSIQSIATTFMDVNTQGITFPEINQITDFDVPISLGCLPVLMPSNMGYPMCCLQFSYNQLPTVEFSLSGISSLHMIPN